MSEDEHLRNLPEVNEAVQAVVNRVLSWHASAPIETVKAELIVEQTAQQIHDADVSRRSTMVVSRPTLSPADRSSGEDLTDEPASPPLGGFLTHRWDISC